MLTTCK